MAQFFILSFYHFLKSFNNEVKPDLDPWSQTQNIPYHSLKGLIQVYSHHINTQEQESWWLIEIKFPQSKFLEVWIMCAIELFLKIYQDYQTYLIKIHIKLQEEHHQDNLFKECSHKQTYLKWQEEGDWEWRKYRKIWVLISIYCTWLLYMFDLRIYQLLERNAFTHIHSI